MRIVTTTDVFPKGYPAEKAAERLAAAGFEGLDMGLDYWVYGQDSPFLGSGYREWARSLRRTAERLGTPYTHAHAPGGADSTEYIDRATECAALLGARYLVVHPLYRDADGREIGDPERFIALNAEAVIPWLKSAEKHDVVILSENLLDGASVDPRIISELVKKTGSDRFGWCFDTGHAHCCGFSPDVLSECGIPPLSLHLQDNCGDGDDHLIPGDGTIDWHAAISALGRIGYKGDCVLEAHHQCIEAPDEEREAVLSRLLERAKNLRLEMTKVCGN